MMRCKKCFLSSVVLFVLFGSSLIVLVNAEASWVMWSQTYGGIENNYANSVVQASDGGFVLAGKWLVKTDELGNLEWNRTYEGADRFSSLVEVSDGGFVLAGDTRSYGAESADFWLVKTGESGNIEWNQTYGGADFDRAYSLVKTSDGGYALTGKTLSFGAGEYDVWLVKTDGSGNMEWSRTYGGAGNDYAFSLVETSDGGFAFAGGNRLVKTDGSGNMEWNQTYGGTGNDAIRSLVEMSDGGFALAGYTRSFGAGNYDFWLVKTDGSGNIMWNKTYGGVGYDRAYSLVEVSGGGFALVGETDSFGAGGYDFWFVRTNEQGVPEFPSWIILPIFVTATLFALIIKKRLFPPRS